MRGGQLASLSPRRTAAPRRAIARSVTASFGILHRSPARCRRSSHFTLRLRGKRTPQIHKPHQRHDYSDGYPHPPGASSPWGNKPPSCTGNPAAAARTWRCPRPAADPPRSRPPAPPPAAPGGSREASRSAPTPPARVGRARGMLTRARACSCRRLAGGRGEQRTHSPATSPGTATASPPLVEAPGRPAYMFSLAPAGAVSLASRT